MAGNVIIISSPSGGGKGTLIRELLTRVSDIGYSVSLTTRAKRAGETDGVDYRFVSKEEFEAFRQAGLFLEFAEVHGNFYGTSRAVTEELMFCFETCIKLFYWSTAVYAFKEVRC